MQFDMVIWLFPLLFMLHDFEEILFMRSFLVRNRDRLQRLSGRLPLLIPKTLSAEAFALGVLVEFFLLCVVTVTAVLSQSYLIWFGFFAAFTLHLFIHLVQWVFFKRCIPAATTSLAMAPVCVYLLTYVTSKLALSVPALIASAIACSLFTLALLLLLHRMMPAFDRWLSRWRGEM